MDIEQLWFQLYRVDKNGKVQERDFTERSFRAMRRNGWLYQRTRGWYELSELGQRALEDYRADRREWIG